MQIERGYPRTCAIGRDVSLETRLALKGLSPSDVQWRRLCGELESAAQALGVAPIFPCRPSFVLAELLRREQRESIDRVYLPLYSSSLEADEEPRERMEYLECQERMVDLRATAQGLTIFWSSRPFAGACGEYADKPRIFWAREGVAALFLKAVKAFNAIGIAPQVEDGYRPPSVQAGLYRARVRSVQEQHPYLSADETLREARAKTACAPYRAAHMGGAAIDFTLCDMEGRPLDLGNPYPTGGAATVLCFPYVTWEQYRTRQLFAYVSLMAGLIPYAGEDWHVSLGDGLAALVSGQFVVRYGPLKDFDRATGKVIPYDSNEARKLFPATGVE